MQNKVIMYTNIPLPVLATAAAILLTVYGLVAVLAYRKRLFAILSRPSSRMQMKGSGLAADHYFGPLIDKPADHPTEQARLTVNATNTSDDVDIQMIDDEPCSFLLKEAEWVVEQIQEVVDHITSRPANPDEVFTKIRAIVSQYTLFENTEYYEAINNFVAVTVQRDCDLALTADDLKALWWTDAA